MDIHTKANAGETHAQNIRLLRLLQLASPVLPVGAYSYSEGIESLVQKGTISSADQLEQWLVQELQYGAVRLEAAMMLRSHRATVAQDLSVLETWNQWLSAARETEELRSQSLQMGRSLLRLFQALSPDFAPVPSDPCHFAIAFGLVAAAWHIETPWATLGYLHSWATNLVSAGIKLIPLGQTAGQQLLVNLDPTIAQATQDLLSLQDEDLSSSGWGLTLASMSHETLYSRLFRS
ncbi:urease accessory protein UreF [Myxacorys almedinensis]|uniref:Urease accessory protein UreF n=1 Tax=Myxacorys almedinensis A TaxID=2690445 RepID=A0A8J7Z3Q6_9CYAN|nr:urease accessory protein UreF [Myxacorys almedinensis]NDJ17558.1 urease accessory protein UreF [Myxacorys almedinensis A]